MSSAQPLPTFGLTPTPKPTIRTARGEVARKTFLSQYEELAHLIATQNDDDPDVWVDPMTANTGLVVRFGYIKDGIPYMLNPENGWNHDNGLPFNPTHLPSHDPDFDADVLIDSNRKPIWVNYDSRRAQNRFEFEHWLKNCGHPTKCTVGLDGIARYNNMRDTTPEQRIDMARHALAAIAELCDGDRRLTNPPLHIDTSIAMTLEPDTLAEARAIALLVNDEDPYRYEFFDPELHDHYMTGGITYEEARTAELTQDPLYGHWQFDEATGNNFHYELDPVVTYFRVRNYGVNKTADVEYDEAERRARNRALTITRNLGLDSAGSFDIGMDVDSADKVYATPEVLPHRQ